LSGSCPAGREQKAGEEQKHYYEFAFAPERGVIPVFFHTYLQKRICADIRVWYVRNAALFFMAQHP
jgi:hypothetical protein